MRATEASPGKSKLGFLIRLAGVLILIWVPFYFLSPELGVYLDPANTGSRIDFELTQLPLHSVSLQSRLILLLIYTLKYSILVVGLFAVARILDMITNGHWFLPGFSKLVKFFGISLIVFTLASGIATVLATATIGYDYFIHMDRYDEGFSFHYAFSTDSLLIILVGTVLAVVSKVLKKASDNSQDLEQFV